MLQEHEIDALVRRIAGRLQPLKIIVFGSYAKGAATPKSDLDLFVVKDTSLPMHSRALGAAPILAGMLIPVDVHVYTPEEVEEYRKDPLSFVSSVLATGRTVFEA